VIKSRRVTRAKHLVCMGKKRNAYRVSMGIPERKRSTGRHKI
jgi:hypothetical protein